MNWEELKKNFGLWLEDRKRGGKEGRANSRRNRREETLLLKTEIYTDLEWGWTVGDFRLQMDDIDLIKEGPQGITLTKIRELHKKYRSF